MRPLPVLKRFEIVVLKDRNPPNDRVQVPAAARIDFYRQGATVAAGCVFSPGDPENDVMVFHRGTLAPGDDVQVGTTTSDVLKVQDPLPADDRLVRLRYVGALELAPFDRLVRLTARPLVCIDPTGMTSEGVSYLDTQAATGRASGYLREYRFDYIVSGVGLEPRLHVDAEGSFVIRSP